MESTTQNVAKFLEWTLDKHPWMDIIWNCISEEAIKSCFETLFEGGIELTKNPKKGGNGKIVEE